MTSTESEGSPPRTGVAGYRIERQLGRGSMGAVYLVHDRSGAARAMKLLDLGGNDSAELARAFEREVALSRVLEHPGIVRVFDAGRAGDLAYVVMELVGGSDLGRLRAGGRPLPVDLALAITERVAWALAHAHERGIVHRDVKPANILVDEAAGQVKLADFGLARLAMLQRSRTGMLAGTPAYMAPEQLADGALDARADLYSLGVVLFELLAGRLPHEADSLGELLRRVSRLPAPDLATLQPQVPSDLAQLVARVLDKDPARRPPDATALAAQLRAIAQALAPAPPPTPTPPAAPFGSE